MESNPADEWDWAERWDLLYDVLSAEPRREIVVSLLDEPKERRLPLPEAARSPNQTVSSETLAIELRHHHLPKLAEAGYVRWESEPFCVQRGPHFPEPALIAEAVFDSMDEIPASLFDNCRVLLEMTDDGTN